LLSNNSERIRALEASVLEVVERVAPGTPPAAASPYIRTKKEKMGRLMDIA
jgi:GTP cyclohydrolase II